jgi:hypothetical protein
MCKDTKIFKTKSDIFSNPCLKFWIEEYCLQSQLLLTYNVSCIQQKQLKKGTMTTVETTNHKVLRKNGNLFFNLAIILTSFTVALVALPQEMFFVVAIIVLIVLRIIERDVAKHEKGQTSLLTKI